MISQASILIVDDDPGIRQLAARAFALSGCDVHQAADGNGAIKRLEASAIDLVVIDIIMPDKEGVETILEIHRRWPETKVIAMSGGGRIDAETFLDLAKSAGAHAILRKPFSFKELSAVAMELLGPASA